MDDLYRVATILAKKYHRNTHILNYRVGTQIKRGKMESKGRIVGDPSVTSAR